MQALKLASTTDMDKDTWLEVRKKGLGGSDIAAICGLSPFTSALQVYLDKIGDSLPREENEAMYWGTRLEEVVAQEFAERTGYKVRKHNFIMQHPHHSHMLANIDRYVVGQNAGLECKTTSAYKSHEWDNEEIPAHYALQGHHYLAVTGFERWYFACLIGGNRFEWRVIERDESIIQNLITIEHDFWHNHVLAKVPPQVTASDTKLLDGMYPSSAPTTCDISEIYYDLIRTLLDTKQALKQATDAHEDAKNKVKALMGENELALWQGEKFVSWKTNAKGSRVFKIIGGI